MISDVEVGCFIHFDTETLVGKNMPEFFMIGIIEKCKEKLSKDSRYWPNEAKQDLKMAPHWSAQKWIDVMAKGSGNKVATLLETR